VGIELPADRIRQRMLAEPRLIVVTDRDHSGSEPPQEDVKRQVLREHFEACSSTETGAAVVTVYARGQCRAVRVSGPAAVLRSGTRQACGA
jgi:hypothetical protein